MSGNATAGAPSGVCTFCGLAYQGRRNQCSRCGTLLGDAAEDAKRLGRQARRAVQARKALADTLFLVGLLLGGPMMTIGGELRIGLFLALAGALASVLRRYSEWSTPGTIVVGSAAAITIATALVEPPTEPLEGELPAEAARAAFVFGLSSRSGDVFVETRGAGNVAVWFTVPDALAGECGDYPPPEVRAHLADLGFVRVVVADRNQQGGLCSFRP